MNSPSSPTRRFLLRLLPLALLCVAACGAVHAQTPPPPQSDDNDEPDFIVPARPTASNPAEFQRPGVLQLEYGFNGNWRTPGPTSEQDTPLALRFAVSRRLLIEFDGDTPLSQSANGIRNTGTGDTLFGVQGVLLHESKSHPGVTLAYYVKLPSASAARALGTGRVDHNFIAFVSKNIRGTTFDFNAIYLLAGRTTDDGHASSAQAAFAASHGVTRRFGVQGELSGFTRNDARPGALFTLGVVTYQLNRRLVLDGGLRGGLTHDAPRVGAVAGLTVGIADLYKHRGKHH